MQDLGISNSTPQSDNRLKNLFWPTISTATDVDTLGTQGFWICVIVAVLAFCISLFAGSLFAGLLVLVFYFLGAIGVREHDRFTAVVVFLMFLTDTVLAFGIWKVLLCVVLLSNMRATFIASSWKAITPDSEMPLRFSETWGDKFSDKMPAWLWPKVRVIYYIYASLFLLLTVVGLVVLLNKGLLRPFH